MAIKELYIPADRGTMNPLVNYDELYSFDVDFFITSNNIIPAPVYGSSKIELAKNLAFSKNPIDIPNAYTTITNPSATDSIYALLLFTAYNKDKSKNATARVSTAGWIDPTGMESSIPLIREHIEENKYVLKIRSPYERIMQLSATTRLEKIGIRQYRASIYNIKTWCSNME